jgi:hypothetical protein
MQLLSHQVFVGGVIFDRWLIITFIPIFIFPTPVFSDFVLFPPIFHH